MKPPPFSDKPEDAITSGLLWLNIGSIVLTALATFGYIKWQDQNDELEQLTAMVTQLQQAPAPVAVPQVAQAQVLAPAAQQVAAAQMASAPPAPVQNNSEDPLVTRNATADMTSFAPIEQAAPVSAVAQPAPVSAPSTVQATTELDPQTVRNATRLETLAVIEAGVQELVGAVVDGTYDIHTNYEDDHFSGRIHFAFVGFEEDQVELEQYIAAAAEAGIIAYSNSVVDVDGSVNGHIMLFDLVERAMENGTLQEQRAVQKMQREALALLNETVDVGENLDAQGRQYYVVERGDSLAYIALQFYGNTNDYLRIYNANRDQISSPEKIRVGQRLLIPSA